MDDIKKIFVTGDTGMLGNSILQEFLKEHCFKIYGISRNKQYTEQYMHIALDLTDSHLLQRTLDKIKPDIIIHCAAMVSVDNCEENREDAYNIHVKATKILASYKPQDTKFIYISTDSVFDGYIGNYSEIDNANPLNYYAKTKFEGEKICLDINPNTIVIRTNIYGFHTPKGKSLAEWAIENLENNKSINGFTDVYFNPVYVGQLAKIIKKICKDINYNGILNVGCNEYISKYEFLRKLAREFKYSEQLICKVSVDDFEFKADRPKNTTLNVEKMAIICNEIPNIELGLIKMYEEIKEG